MFSVLIEVLSSSKLKSTIRQFAHLNPMLLSAWT